MYIYICIYAYTYIHVHIDPQHHIRNDPQHYENVNQNDEGGPHEYLQKRPIEATETLSTKRRHHKATQQPRRDHQQTGRPLKPLGDA